MLRGADCPLISLSFRLQVRCLFLPYHFKLRHAIWVFFHSLPLSWPLALRRLQRAWPSATAIARSLHQVCVTVLLRATCVDKFYSCTEPVRLLYAGIGFP